MLGRSRVALVLLAAAVSCAVAQHAPPRTAENQPILLQDQRTEVQFHGTP
ncbi:ASAH1 isoform 57 [Pongo abelii]|uniref:ASAH1 isoform 57 n=1 Tax=Pongo abelii TaxID=9601 RepID=A0A2J8X424_PONAB|nr:ASAH1 isoform 57 [Pongo abelii]